MSKIDVAIENLCSADQFRMYQALWEYALVGIGSEFVNADGKHDEKLNEIFQKAKDQYDSRLDQLVRNRAMEVL